MQPMSNIGGTKNQVTSKLCLCIYLMTSSLPVMVLITFVIISTIKRESIILLPIIIVTSIHPIISVPIGILAATLGTLKMKILPNSVKCQYISQCLRRFFTYSINLHLTLMASIVYYLFQIWSNSNLASTWNYDNKAFDQCPCIEREEACENMDIDFQTMIMNIFPFSIPIPTILFLVMTTSFLCHVVHSIITSLPPPLTLYDYITGTNVANERKLGIEEPLELRNMKDQKKVLAKEQNGSKVLRILCSLFALIYFGGVICSQLTFQFFAKTSNETKHGKLGVESNWNSFEIRSIRLEN